LLLQYRSLRVIFRRKNMVTAIILLKVARERIKETAQELSDIEGMSEVFSVSGRYDLIAIARVKDNDELAELVTGKMLKVEGITDSETMLAFRAYSRHDLEGMFSVGFEA
jgi:DNA-binding Lrp family transcriptional regulator